MSALTCQVCVFSVPYTLTLDLRPHIARADACRFPSVFLFIPHSRELKIAFIIAQKEML